MATKGFGKLGKEFKKLARNASNPKKALQVIGRNTVNRHVKYFRGGSQATKGGGPPGDKWPALAASTIEAKKKGHGQYRGKAKTQKLVNTGLLARGFDSKVSGNSVEIFNREDRKIDFLQRRGVGKKNKRFKIVAIDTQKDDPQILKDSEEILANFIFTGKATK